MTENDYLYTTSARFTTRDVLRLFEALTELADQALHRLSRYAATRPASPKNNARTFEARALTSEGAM